MPRDRYEIENDVIVDRVGFVTPPGHGVHTRPEAQTDSLTSNGGVEFKCAEDVTTHIEVDVGRRVLEEHNTQVRMEHRLPGAGLTGWTSSLFDPRISKSRSSGIARCGAPRMYRDDKHALFGSRVRGRQVQR